MFTIDAILGVNKKAIKSSDYNGIYDYVAWGGLTIAHQEKEVNFQILYFGEFLRILNKLIAYNLPEIGYYDVDDDIEYKKCNNPLIRFIQERLEIVMLFRWEQCEIRVKKDEFIQSYYEFYKSLIANLADHTKISKSIIEKYFDLM